MNSKKYELLKSDTVNHLGRTLYRIRRISNGDLGGYIEKESNLSHFGDSWVYGNASVYDNACVFGNARVYDNARVYGKARVFDDAMVSGNARVYGKARVFDDAMVSGKASVFDDARVSGKASVFGDAMVFGKAMVRNFDEISARDNIVNTLGYRHSITITPTSVNIGCMSFTFDQLDTFNSYEGYSKEEIEEIKQLVSIGINKIMRDI